MNKRYDGRINSDRIALAKGLETLLVDMGFTQFKSYICPFTKRRLFEKVFYLEFRKNVYIMVRSKIANVKNIIRKSATDANISVVYEPRGLNSLSKGHKSKGLVGNIQVSFNKEVNDIVMDMAEKIAIVWMKVELDDKCSRCKSPLFMSKKGNKVCAIACWDRSLNKQY